MLLELLVSPDILTGKDGDASAVGLEVGDAPAVVGLEVGDTPAVVGLEVEDAPAIVELEVGDAPPIVGLEVGDSSAVAQDVGEVATAGVRLGLEREVN